ncbi:MAG: type II pantothenate kinase [Clostridiaceae bacterium]|nr:type II pantothenate kinase [Clostridiaceae bacterium]
MIIGIDIGGSTTKIVGFDGENIISPLMVKAGDPRTSAYGAFGKFLLENKLELTDVKRIMVTGVGSAFLSKSIYRIDTKKVDEITAVGLGGKYLSGLDRAVVVSMGTGTAVIGVDGDDISHIGGTGVGGGTIIGICDKLVGVRSIDHIVDLAENGDLSKIDLTIGDISSETISNMNGNVTASNFGKASDIANKSDLALGVINMVFQTIGIVAVLAGRGKGMTRIVLTGNLSKLSLTKRIFDDIGGLYGVEFSIPEYADFATAIGAAIYGK